MTERSEEMWAMGHPKRGHIHWFTLGRALDEMSEAYTRGFDEAVRKEYMSKGYRPVRVTVIWEQAE